MYALVFPESINQLRLCVAMVGWFSHDYQEEVVFWSLYKTDNNRAKGPAAVLYCTAVGFKE